MIVNQRYAPEIASSSVRQRVQGDVEAALQSVATHGNQFIVNDTPWFVDDGGILKARVVNKAGYISTQFQQTLRAKNWTIHKKRDMDGQEIDGFVEVPVGAGTVYSLTRDQFRSFFELFWTDHIATEDIDREFQRYYQTYHRRDFFGLGSLAAKYHPFFTAKPAPDDAVMKIGLEFETGNIASSFRALWKLNVLFLSKRIDAGVFITSVDKANAAGRIWPPANRNGSFVELEHRNYKSNVLLPLWEFSFAPDGFDRNAPYLGAANRTYTLKPTGRTKVIDAKTYEVFNVPGKRGEELLRLSPPPPPHGTPAAGS